MVNNLTGKMLCTMLRYVYKSYRGANLMKAIVQTDYGSPDVLELKEQDKPKVKKNEVLLGIIATDINAGDVFTLGGSPWIARFAAGFPKPKNYVIGWDFAGHVEEVGEKVTQFPMRRPPPCKGYATRGRCNRARRS